MPNKKIVLACFFLLYTFTIHSQQFLISNPTIYSDRFSIDRFAGDVYYHDMLYGKIYVKNLENNTDSLSIFPKMPSFMKHQHKAIYNYDKDTYVYDFKSQQHTKLIERNRGVYDVVFLSPNDSNLLNLIESVSGDSIELYSFDGDSISFHEKGDLFHSSDHFVWIDDNTILYETLGGEYLVRYSFTRRERDTLLVCPGGIGNSLIGYTFNKAINTLYYSYSENVPRLHGKDMSTGKDSIYYDLERDEPGSHCTGSPAAPIFLRWNGNRMVFFLSFATITGSGIYVYDLDSGKTYRYTECDDFTYKYFTEWFDKSIIVYRTMFYDIKGSYLTNPMGIEEDFQKLPESYNLEQNYPNPFNPVTTIKFSIPTSPKTPLLSKERGRGEVVTLKVYDILGREVAVLVNEEKAPGNYEVVFDASKLSSGVYIYRLTTNDFTASRKMMVLK